MKMPAYIKATMNIFPGSFINQRNELILIPWFNVYFCLDDVSSEGDLYCKMCEWVSRDCCYAERFGNHSRLREYYDSNIRGFNAVCGTHFSVDDMKLVYQRLGNGVNHRLCKEFVRSGFSLKVLEEPHE